MAASPRVIDDYCCQMPHRETALPAELLPYVMDHADLGILLNRWRCSVYLLYQCTVPYCVGVHSDVHSCAEFHSIGYFVLHNTCSCLTVWHSTSHCDLCFTAIYHIVILNFFYSAFHSITVHLFVALNSL